MKLSTFTMLVSTVVFAGIAQAQGPASEIRESTDPARVAEVEQRAADIQAREQAARQDMTSGDSGDATGDSRKRARQESSQQSRHGGGHGPGRGASGGQGGGSSNK